LHVSEGRVGGRCPGCIEGMNQHLVGERRDSNSDVRVVETLHSPSKDCLTPISLCTRGQSRPLLTGLNNMSYCARDEHGNLELKLP
jgi:hypothetical protein